MGRSPCCDKQGLKKGPWTPEEDQKLLAYIEEHGHGNWRALPPKAGLQRCGKSCRLRWTNYLRPDIKRGKFSLQEEQTIIQLHALLGNRWSAIATHLPKRTDNEIKNYWNTHLKKRLAKMGIDPVTHKPKNDALLPTVDGGQQSKSAAKLSHMAQWESARLEAEARLARQSKLRSNASSLAAHQPLVTSPSLSGSDHHHPLLLPGSGLKAWHNIWPSTSATTTTSVDQEGLGIVGGVGLTGPESGAHGVGSPTSTLSFSENGPPPGHMVGPNTGSVIEFMGHDNTTTTNTNESSKSSSRSCDHLGGLIVKEEGEHANEWKRSFDNSLSFSFSNGGGDQDDDDEDNDHDPNQSFMEGFTELLLSNTYTTTATIIATATTTMACGEKSPREEGGAETDNNDNNNNNTNNNNSSSNGRGDYYEDNKNYWNSILNLVNSSPPHSPMF